jgi:hypothetical protein
VLKVPETEGRMEEVEELERDRDVLLERYGAMVTGDLAAFGPEDGAGPTTLSASTSSPTRTAP